MAISPTSSNSSTGPSEVQQALLFKKQVALEAAQKEQIVESARPADSNASGPESTGKYLNAKA